MGDILRRKLPRTVVILGLVSFFNDLASEMVTPFIPILIATVLGAGPVILGLVGWRMRRRVSSSCGQAAIPMPGVGGASA